MLALPTSLRKTPARPCQRPWSARHIGRSRTAIGAARQVLCWLALRGSPTGNLCLPDTVFDPLRREIIGDILLAQHVAVENAGERRCVFRSGTEDGSGSRDQGGRPRRTNSARFDGGRATSSFGSSRRPGWRPRAGSQQGTYGPSRRAGLRLMFG